MTKRRANQQSEKIKDLDPERRRKATFKTKKKEEEKVKIQRILRPVRPQTERTRTRMVKQTFKKRYF